MSENWQGIVKAVAPTLAGMLGGPLAAVAVRELSNKILGKPDGTEADVAAAIASGVLRCWRALRKPTRPSRLDCQTLA